MALSGIKVIEFAGLAPGPFAGLILADNGADVIRIDRLASSSADILCRGKRSLAVNLKVARGRDLLKRLVASADVLIDPFRPGVMEKLGLGPGVFLGQDGLNKRLVYARLAGFPRNGPHKDMAGHDINYLALSGVLSMLPGTTEKPTFPLNLLADFAGGGLTCGLGILLALVERGKTGLGQVVDTDMVSGVRYVSSFPLLLSLLPTSSFGPRRGENLLDGGSPFYNIYTCKDGKWMSVGCLEPQFFASFLSTLLQNLPTTFSLESGWRPTTDSQTRQEEWPKLKEFFTKAFLTQTRDCWAQKFHGTDGCALPVLDVYEAATLDSSGSVVPRPHPKISDASLDVPDGGLHVLTPGGDDEVILKELGVLEDERRQLITDGAMRGEQARSKL
ncbi:CoA-transferase family III [Hymenopellis radicata]|nr:CoA-transferase family III [Hymenopellis radicata]